MRHAASAVDQLRPRGAESPSRALKATQVKAIGCALALAALIVKNCLRNLGYTVLN
jgi:hypothetical protein